MRRARRSNHNNNNNHNNHNNVQNNCAVALANASNSVTLAGGPNNEQSTSSLNANNNNRSLSVPNGDVMHKYDESDDVSNTNVNDGCQSSSVFTDSDNSQSAMLFSEGSSACELNASATGSSNTSSDDDIQLSDIDIRLPSTASRNDCQPLTAPMHNISVFSVDSGGAAGGFDDFEVPDFERLYSSVKDQPLTVLHDVIADVPNWLRGKLYLIGPGHYEIDDVNSMEHLFDAMAAVQCVTFGQQRITYQRQLLRSRALTAIYAKQRNLHNQFGTAAKTDNTKCLLSRLFTYLFGDLTTDNTSYGLFVHRGHLFATGVATTMLTCIDQQTLAVNGVLEPHVLRFLTPHVQPDPNDRSRLFAVGQTGREFIIFATARRTSTTTTMPRNALDSNPDCRNWEFELDFNIVSTVGYDLYAQPLLHSFAVTSNHVVLIEQPFHLDALRYKMRKLKPVALLDCYEWKTGVKSIIHAIEKSTGYHNPQRYVTSPFFCLHHVNAYEDKCMLILDVLAYRDASILNALNVSDLRDGLFPSVTGRTQLLRFVLPLLIDVDTPTGTNLLQNASAFTNGVRTRARAILLSDGYTVDLIPEILSDKSVEYPAINRNFAGRNYQYCYALEQPFDGSALIGTKVIKLDVQNRTALEWWRESVHCFAAPPIFVSRPDAVDEDDGVLLVVVSNTKWPDRSHLIVIDARTMQQMSHVNVGCFVPPVFGLEFVPEF